MTPALSRRGEPARRRWIFRWIGGQFCIRAELDISSTRKRNDCRSNRFQGRGVRPRETGRWARSAVDASINIGFKARLVGFVLPPANLEVLNSHRYGGTVASEKDQVSAYKFFRKFTSPLSPYPSSWPRDGKKGHSSMAAGCRRGCGHGDWLLLLRMDRHDMTVYNYELFLGSWKQRLGSTAVLKRSTIWCKHTLVTSHAAVTVQ